MANFGHVVISFIAFRYLNKQNEDDCSAECDCSELAEARADYLEDLWLMNHVADELGFNTTEDVNSEPETYATSDLNEVGESFSEPLKLLMGCLG